jgi:hypothetical protein
LFDVDLVQIARQFTGDDVLQWKLVCEKPITDVVAPIGGVL